MLCFFYFKSHIFSVVGKAPPNLAQGVPPLLANQYIMGPNGLLPAYTVIMLFCFCPIGL